MVGTARRVAAVIGAHVSAVHESDNRGDGKEDDVHDAKCPAGLEHGAGLVVDEVIAGANDPDIANGEIPVVATLNANTVGVALKAPKKRASTNATKWAFVDER
jgi:hypothetical protein